MSYEEGIKKIASFGSVRLLAVSIAVYSPIQVESFWSLWTHLSPPSALLPTTDYLLFHSGVRRPVWEDPLNLSGGKWIIRLKKGVADRLWEDLILAIIGDQFDDCNEEGAEYPEISGCTISVRQYEDIVSLWNRVDADVRLREKIRFVLTSYNNHLHNLMLYSQGHSQTSPQSAAVHGYGI